ncbi:MAG: AAA+ family ATPase, partial [Chloroflexota bacterium]
MTSRLLNVQPWHKVVRLRDDLRTGELPLSFFAADLYDVAMGKGLSVYRDPKEFFTLTYPTFNLREMAKDVILRLSRKNDKAVRLLDLTYGGGKTHSLVTLFHLTNDPDHLPELSAVQDFRQHAGV